MNGLRMRKRPEAVCKCSKGWCEEPSRATKAIRSIRRIRMNLRLCGLPGGRVPTATSGGGVAGKASTFADRATETGSVIVRYHGDPHASDDPARRPAPADGTHRHAARPRRIRYAAGHGAISRAIDRPG